jgi:protein-S-isoprenylcysteine O-methyltransferase Ste14
MMKQPFGRTKKMKALSMADNMNNKKSGLDDALQQLRARFDGAGSKSTDKFDFSSFKNPLQNVDTDSTTTSSTTGSTSTTNDNSFVSDNISSTSKREQEFDVSTITQSLLAVKDNMMAGEFGARGEVYFIVQVVLFIFIVLGGVPIIGNPIESVLGPLLALGGLGVGAISINDLGSNNLSPWPKPVDNDDGSVQTNGVYQYVRHPMYTGILMFCFGLGIVTDSASRLVLSTILYYALDKKSTYEEEQLIVKYGTNYKQYQKSVTGKFFPNELLDDLTSKLPIGK